jgi:hypothetical protein
VLVRIYAINAFLRHGRPESTFTGHSDRALNAAKADTCQPYAYRRQRATLVRPYDSRCSDFVVEQSKHGRSTWLAE